MLFNGNNISWNARQYPPPHAAVIWGSTVFTLLITLFGLWLAVRKRETHDFPTFAVMLLCISLAAPIAWEHSYGYTFPLFLFAMLAAFQDSRTDIPRLVLATASFLLASHFLHFINLRFHAGRLNILQSYLFFAELILLGLLARWSCKQTAQNGMSPREE